MAERIHDTDLQAFGAEELFVEPGHGAVCGEPDAL